MRYRSLGWIMMGAWLGAFPIAAHADYLSTAKTSLKKGDLKSAQIDLRNAVRSDPQNAEAHYWLGRVTFELGDPVASEREAIAARDRGFDPHQTVPLLAQALLAQNKFDDLLSTLKPEGKDPMLDASILVARGYAQVGLNAPRTHRNPSPRPNRSHQTRWNRCWPMHGLRSPAPIWPVPRQRSTGRSPPSRNRPRRCWPRRSCCG